MKEDGALVFFLRGSKKMFWGKKNDILCRVWFAYFRETIPLVCGRRWSVVLSCFLPFKGDNKMRSEFEIRKRLRAHEAYFGDFSEDELIGATLRARAMELRWILDEK